MRAKTVNFTRGQDSKRALDVGVKRKRIGSDYIKDLSNYFSEYLSTEWLTPIIISGSGKNSEEEIIQLSLILWPAENLSSKEMKGLRAGIKEWFKNNTYMKVITFRKRYGGANRYEVITRERWINNIIKLDK